MRIQTAAYKFFRRHTGGSILGILMLIGLAIVVFWGISALSGPRQWTQEEIDRVKQAQNKVITLATSNAISAQCTVISVLPSFLVVQLDGDKIACIYIKGSTLVDGDKFTSTLFPVGRCAYTGAGFVRNTVMAYVIKREDILWGVASAKASLEK